ncbi:ABC transporter permease [Zestomonas carbonaria]|uniref:ABC transmembrane type-1 domain-containing protein n=1 Tax=Zestomonas carbonaria TaxID=2762745 RepID=A0A7U7ER23_9GAMM|nr:ABC transporter permease subunit [Pseudomonas carbonaria]CAD5109516.1 hypothetical protein PSEWESI4_03821 [Pseudomonas carbonaria]
MSESIGLPVSALHSPRRPWALLWRYRESLLLWLVLFALWELASRYTPLGDNPLIPSPQATFKALGESLPELWKGTLSSFAILLPGFALAVLLGGGLGLWGGSRERAGRIWLPFARVAAPIPPTIYIPYAIAILPTFLLSAIFIVFIGAFWPVFQSAVSGAHGLDRRYQDNARTLGLRGWRYYRLVLLPAALPHIFSGMAVGLGFSFILLTVAELFGANAGLGRFIQYYADFADYPRMVAGILYTGLVTFLCMSLLDLSRRRVLFWSRR